MTLSLIYILMPRVELDMTILCVTFFFLSTVACHVGLCRLSSDVAVLNLRV